MKIYVVVGSTGEYSDHREWFLKAFTDEKLAQDLVLKASARAREIFGDGTYDERVNQKNEFDPAMEIDYTGTNYNYEELELVGSP